MNRKRKRDPRRLAAPGRPKSTLYFTQDGTEKGTLRFKTTTFVTPEMRQKRVEQLAAKKAAFEWRHMRHEVRRADGSWVPFVGSWERDKEQDGREESTFSY